MVGSVLVPLESIDPPKENIILEHRYTFGQTALGVKFIRLIPQITES